MPAERPLMLTSASQRGIRMSTHGIHHVTAIAGNPRYRTRTISLSVPEMSVDYWTRRLEKADVHVDGLIALLLDCRQT